MIERFTIGVASVLLLALASPAPAVEAPYPFEGVWIRAERTCTASTVRERVYTAREVVSPRGRCMIRRVTPGATGTFELLEDCHRSDHQGTVTEIIKMASPDQMTLRRQISRLKIPRQVHYARCTATPGPVSTPPSRGRRP